MSYVVLARKYRPQRFDDMVGQEHVGRTLGNAIKHGRVHHAYLFAGARGLGKTTTARIFAKGLVCERGPTPEPCNVCEQCVAVNEGRSVDVMEIDGASNNSVENIRNLREQVHYLPQSARRKVYIIDEVHMLTTSAFNALLKTLEEPPPHVNFVFATTEPQKVLPTILSRVSRLDFRRVSVDQLVGYLRTILANEGLQVDDGGLRVIARAGGGSVRDSLTLLDQAIAFADDPKAIGETEVRRVLGQADVTAIGDLVDAVLQRQPDLVIQRFDALVSAGHDLTVMSLQVLEHLRDLMLVKVCRDASVLPSATTSELEALREQAKPFDATTIGQTFDRFSRVIDRLPVSRVPRLLLEMGLLDLANSEPVMPLGDLIERLEALGGGGGAPPRGGGSRANPGSAGRGTRSTAGFDAAPVQPSPAVDVRSGQPEFELGPSRNGEGTWSPESAIGASRDGEGTWSPEFAIGASRNGDATPSLGSSRNDDGAPSLGSSRNGDATPHLEFATPSSRNGDATPRPDFATPSSRNGDTTSYSGLATQSPPNGDASPRPAFATASSPNGDASSPEFATTPAPGREHARTWERDAAMASPTAEPRSARPGAPSSPAPSPRPSFEPRPQPVSSTETGEPRSPNEPPAPAEPEHEPIDPTSPFAKYALGVVSSEPEPSEATPSDLRDDRCGPCSEPPPSTRVIDLDALRDLDAWEALIGRIREEAPEVSAVLLQVGLQSIEGGVIRLAAPRGSFAQTKLSDPDDNTRAVLVQATRDHFGRPFAVELIEGEPSLPDLPSIVLVEAERRARHLAQIEAEARNHRAILGVLSAFNGRLSATKPLRE